MMTQRLPSGGKAWFVRVKKRRGCGLKPASIHGHVLTGAFAFWVSAITWFFVDDDMGAAKLIAFVVLILASAFLYILTALRMSAPAPDQGKAGRSCS